MSELINQPEQTDDSAYGVLRAVMLSSKQSISESSLRELGLDVDMFIQTYQELVHPYLDYFHGYRNLLEYDPAHFWRHVRRHWDEEAKAVIAPESWEQLLNRFNVLPAADTQVIPVLHNAEFHRFGKDPEYIRITVLLTRKGQWVLWHAEKAKQDTIHIKAEKLFLFETIHEFWETLHELVPDDYSLDFSSDEGEVYPRYLPLLLDKKFRKIVSSTIYAREERIKSMKDSLQNAEARISSVEFTN
jgi:hypothetical protein